MDREAKEAPLGIARVLYLIDCYIFERLIVDSSDDEIYSCIWDTRKTVKTYIPNQTLLLLYISFCNMCSSEFDY